MSSETLYRPDVLVTRDEAVSVCDRAGFPADFSGTDEIPTKYQIVRALISAK